MDNYPKNHSPSQQKCCDAELQELWGHDSRPTSADLLAALNHIAQLQGPRALQEKLRHLPVFSPQTLSPIWCRWKPIVSWKPVRTLLPIGAALCAILVFLYLAGPRPVLTLTEEDLVEALAEPETEEIANSTDIALLNPLDDDFIALEETL